MSIDAEEILQDASKTGKMDYTKWPEVLQHVLPALDNIVHNDFPTPRIPIIVSAQQSPLFTRNGEAAGESTPTRSPKTTVIPATPQPTPGAAAASNITATPEQQAASPSVVLNSQPPASNTTEPPPSTPSGNGGSAAPQLNTSVSAPEGTLPPPILALYNGIVSMLKGTFGTVPPYTFQRLFELILHPRAHYQTLPAYLRALDKTLSVASAADVYPLPVPMDASPSASGESYLSQANGVNGPPRGARDDGFNGAELTRIPWVRDTAENEGEVDAPGEREDGVGGGAAAQPDRMLLTEAEEQRRQERRTSPNTTANGGEAALDEGQTSTVTVNGHSRGPGLPPLTDTEVEALAKERQARGEDEKKNEDMATARGPEEIGNEDIGPQRSEGHGMPGIVDLEAAVGRPGEGEVVPGSNVQVPEERRAASEEPKEEQAGEGNEMAVDDAEEKKDD